MHSSGEAIINLILPRWVTSRAKKIEGHFDTIDQGSYFCPRKP